MFFPRHISLVTYSQRRQLIWSTEKAVATSGNKKFNFRFQKYDLRALKVGLEPWKTFLRNLEICDALNDFCTNSFNFFWIEKFRKSLKWARAGTLSNDDDESALITKHTQRSLECGLHGFWCGSFLMLLRGKSGKLQMIFYEFNFFQILKKKL